MDAEVGRDTVAEELLLTLRWKIPISPELNLRFVLALLKPFFPRNTPAAGRQDAGNSDKVKRFNPRVTQRQLK
jgi:hypothetical protein